MARSSLQKREFRVIRLVRAFFLKARFPLGMPRCELRGGRQTLRQSVSQSVSCLQIAWKGVGEYVHALTRALPWAGVAFCTPSPRDGSAPLGQHKLLKSAVHWCCESGGPALKSREDRNSNASNRYHRTRTAHAHMPFASDVGSSRSNCHQQTSDAAVTSWSSELNQIDRVPQELTSTAGFAPGAATPIRADSSP